MVCESAAAPEWLMRIDLSSNLREVIPVMDRLLSDQVPFAVAKTLTDVAKAVADEMPKAVEQDLDKPTPFTRQGFYMQGARKDHLQAVVGVKDRQATYLRYQIEGGERQPQRKALRLPAQVQLDAFGNMPKGLVRQLIARAKAGRRATKAQASRFGVSQHLDLFYGEPGDGRPAGIYKRVVIGPTQHQLVPVIVFPSRSAHYEPRFDFERRALQVVGREFPRAWDRAWSLATSTSR